MERVVIAGAAADRGQRAVRKVQVDTPALSFGVYADALAQTPRVDDRCVPVRYNVVSERVVLRAD